MLSSRKRAVSGLSLCIAALAFVTLWGAGYSHLARASDSAADGSPDVSITVPRNNSTYNWNTLVNYSIVVSYHGKSTQYKELPSKQVLLAATYVSDLSAVAAKPASATAPTPAGLLDIIGSNCLGCHEFNAAATGPSFAAIAKRYPQNAATVHTLSAHIRDGSAEMWGQESMPPHPDLTEDQARAMARWILKSAANPDVSYYVGTEGAIRMSAPAVPGPNAGMMLTASYTNLAGAVNPQQAPHGEATIIIHGKGKSLRTADLDCMACSPRSR